MASKSDAHEPTAIANQADRRYLDCPLTMDTYGPHPPRAAPGAFVLELPRCQALSHNVQMSKLTRAKRAQIIRLLLKGSSLASVCRSADVSRAAVRKLLVDAATAFAELQDQAFRDLTCRRLQLDEVWSFAHVKAKRGSASKMTSAGDVWTWVATDGDTRLVPSWRIGDRSPETAIEFANDLAGRIVSRVQITTEGRKVYLDAIEGAPIGGDVGRAMLVKVYGPATEGKRRSGTSLAERNNLAMRISIHHFHRPTKAFSRRIENCARSAVLHYMDYNFCRIDKTLRVTPAMAAGVTGRIWDIDDLVQVLENWESTRGASDH
jgi:IS1 family transposase